MAKVPRRRMAVGVFKKSIQHLYMQYKFRGKRIDNGKWVYGCFVSTSPDEAFILIGVTGHIKRDDYECYMVPVNPETVGMSSSLFDVNNIEIWEGDIYNSIHGIRTYKVMIVNGAFVGGCSEQSCMPLAWDPNGEDDMIAKNPSWCKVIGNIHDNPELIIPADKTATV